MTLEERKENVLTHYRNELRKYLENFRANVESLESEARKDSNMSNNNLHLFFIDSNDVKSNIKNLIEILDESLEQDKKEQDPNLF